MDERNREERNRMDESRKRPRWQEYSRPEGSRFGGGAMFFAGIGIGALVTYLLDPQHGARRRSLLTDKGGYFARTAGRRGSRLYRRTRNQVAGLVATASGLLAPVGPTSDRKLLDRIRSRLGHAAEHLSQLELEVNRGDVRLRGHIPEGEIQGVLRAIRGTRGVRSVIDNLERLAGSPPPTIQ